MTLAVLVLFTGMVGMALLLTVRTRASRAWAKELRLFRMQLPANLTPDDLARWLGMVAASTSAPLWTLRPPTVLGLEIRATARGGIQHYLLVPERAQAAALQSIRAGLPGVRLEPAAHVPSEMRLLAARELSLTNSRRPLAVDRAEAVASAFLASLQPLAHGQELRTVWFFGGAGTPKLVSTASARNDHLLSESVSVEDVRAQRSKDQHPLLLAAVRIGAVAATPRQARLITNRTAATLRGINAPGVRISYRRWMPSKVVARRMARQALPLSNWLLLNTHELSGLLGLPVGETVAAGLALGASRQLPPNPSAARAGLLLARSTYPGTSQALCIGAADRLRHLWLLGPTGVGKSTLIANMALQDATAGRSFALIDPKGDLVADVLARLPDSRHGDVIVLDPSAAYTSDQPIIGLNILGQARTEHERDLATDQIVHVMSSIWADSWGPRTSDVLRNALLTLTHAKAMDGSAFTLIEVAELLTNPTLRRFVTAQPTIPASVRPFWTAYESYSEAQRLQMIGPSLNKLRALTTRTPLRLMLGQSRGVDLGDALNQGKSLLLPLSKGTVGTETAALLGSLVVASLVNAIFARAAQPAAQRRPTFIYLDEFQDVLRLPLDLADALAQFRGLGAGFVLANQYIAQLPDAIRRAVFGTVRSAIVFALQDYDDARMLERRFAPLTASDLMYLPAYEVAMQLSEHNASGRPVTGVTLPLPDAESDGAELSERSAQRFGLLRSDIEDAIRARITPPSRRKQAANTLAFGRRNIGDGQ